MAAPVITMARLMKSAGMGRITKLGKVIAQQGDDVIREATFANGRIGTYRVSNFMGTKTQSVWDGTRSLTFNTTKGNQALCDVYSRTKGEYIELLPRTHTWQIRESINGANAMQQLATGRAKVTPINVKTNIVNGKVQNKVASTQEIHTSTVNESNKGFGTIREHKDLLIGADGKSYPIYQTPNHYTPAKNSLPWQDLSKKPVYAGNGIRPTTQYTEQTPITTLNRDLGANFQPKVNPLWSRLDEMFWRLA